MPLSEEQTTSVEATIRASLRNKFQNYSPESKNMPFHYRLLGKIEWLSIHLFTH